MIQRPKRARVPSPWALVLLAGAAACASTGEWSDDGVLVFVESAGSESSSSAIVEDVTAAGADFVILSAPRDSVWFAEVAAGTGLAMSGPAIEGGVAFAFLTRREALGDTTLAIPVDPDGAVVLHDALYELNGEVFLDLIALRADSIHDLRALVQSFLEYVATDVMTNAPLVLGIHAPDQAVADSIEVLLRPSFRPPTSCQAGGGEVAPGLRGLRLFFGTPAQIRCEHVRHPPGNDQALLVRLVPRR